jgi:hypothetical protein
MRAAALLVLSTALLLAVNAGAQAAPQPAPPPAPDVRAALPGAQAAGATRLTVWGFEVYDVNLFVTNGFRADNWAERPFALELRYLRDFDGDAIAKRSLDEMRRSGPIDEKRSRQWLEEMKVAFPDVKKGDRLLGVYQPGAGARFFHNGLPTGAVPDTAFAQRFFAIWLGAQTSEPAMRDALLATVPR